MLQSAALATVAPFTIALPQKHCTGQIRQAKLRQKRDQWKLTRVFSSCKRVALCLAGLDTLFDRERLVIRGLVRKVTAMSVVTAFG